MFLSADLARGTISLEERDDFTSLVVVATGAGADDDLLALLGPGARSEGDELWLPAATLEALAAPADDGWRSSYRAMLAAVERFGWFDPAADAVKLHVERR